MSKKGAKVDLATFQGASKFDAVLPSGPRVREEGDDGRRRGGRGGFGGGGRDRDFEGGGRDRGDRGGDRGGFRSRGDGDRDGGSGGQWGRGDRGGDRDREGGSSRWESGGGDRDRDRDSGFGGGFGGRSRREQDDNNEDRGGSWARGGSSIRDSDRDSRPSAFASRTADTRPESMRLKLTSKRTEGGDAGASPAVDRVTSSLKDSSIGEESSPASGSGAAPSEDKWTKVFGKSSAAPYQPPSRSSGGFGSGDASSSSGSRFGVRSSQDARNRYSTDEVSDPRFAGIFGSRGGDRGRGGDSDDRGSGSGWQPKKIITTTAAMTEASRKAKEEYEAQQAEKAAAEEKKRLADEARAEAQKAARAAKQAAKDAADKAAREKKEAAAQAAVDEATRAKAEIEAGSAMLASVVASGARGEALTQQLKAKQAENPSFVITMAALVSAALPALNFEDSTPTKLISTASLNWCKDSEFGHALKTLAASNTKASERRKAQLGVLFAVQGFCAEKNFPVIWIAGKAEKGAERKALQKKLVNTLFASLYAAEIVDDDTYLYWADEDETDVVPGKLQAVVQTSEFIAMLREREEEEEGDEDDEVDAPREIVK